MSVRWAADHLATLAKADPAMRVGMNNRLADNWRPLLAVADLAGGKWPESARRAAVELSRPDDRESSRILLLADLHELFERQPSSVLFTREIIAALATRDDRPWSEWGKGGKPISGRQVAALLKPFKIKTNATVRRGNETDKGYRREWFEDSFMRYLSGLEPVTQSPTSNSADVRGAQSVTSEENVTHTVYEKPNTRADYDRVTDPELMSHADEEIGVWTG
jgi:hypothetical protein